MLSTNQHFWSTDKIVACGLVIMGIIAVTGTMFHIYASGSTNGSEVPMAIVSGLTGFLGRGLVTNNDMVTKKKDEEEKDDGLKNKVQSDIDDKRDSKK